MKSIVDSARGFLILGITLSAVFALVAFFSVEGTHWDDLKGTATAITFDEFSHLGMGYFTFRTGTYLLNPEHPPLVKDIAAIPLLFLHPAFPRFTDRTVSAWSIDHRPLAQAQRYPMRLAYENNQSSWGRIFLFHPGNDPDRIAFFERFTVIVFNAALLLTLFCFLAKLWTARTALFAVFLIAASPLTIAHGALVTTDVPSSLLQMIALAAFALALRAGMHRREWRPFALWVFFTTLALLAKFSSLLLLPVMLFGGAVYTTCMGASWKRLADHLVRFGLFLIAVFALISATYALHTVNMSDDAMIRQIVQNYPKELDPNGRDLLVGLVISGPLTRGLAEFGNGIANVFYQLDTAEQHIVFLDTFHGSEGAGPWYFPILYAAKLPPAFLALNVLAAILILSRWIMGRTGSLRKRFTAFLAEPYAFLLLCFAYTYVVRTLASNFQIGVRHILPVIFAVAILTAKAVDSWWDRKYLKVVLAGLSLSLVFSVATAFPQYLPYYNDLSGGTDSGYEIATDSNYDWGQDINRLGAWVRANHIDRIYTDVFADVPVRYYLGRAHEGYSILWNGLPPSGSYVAVSANVYENNVTDPKIPPEKKYSLLKDHLVTRIGKSIFVFRIP